MKPKVYFRADGNSQLGLGHVIRSLALAEMLAEDFACHFFIRSPLPSLKSQILEVCQSIAELPETEDNEAEAQFLVDNHFTGQEIVVLDGYHFKTEYQFIIKSKGCKLVCIDDIHAYHFVADVVINHAGGVSKAIYSAEPYTQFCLGLSYALLRKPFREAAQHREYPERNENDVFICLGGADPQNDTLEVLRKCEDVQNIHQCYVVIGSGYRHQKELDDFLSSINLAVELLPNLSAPEMVQYMKKCGKAITAPSTVAYEYLSVGGELYLTVIAENQVDINHYFLRVALAFPFMEFPLNDNNKRQIALENQARELDGYSKQRFLDTFNAIA